MSEEKCTVTNCDDHNEACVRNCDLGRKVNECLVASDVMGLNKIGPDFKPDRANPVWVDIPFLDVKVILIKIFSRACHFVGSEGEKNYLEDNGLPYDIITSTKYEIIDEKETRRMTGKELFEAGAVAFRWANNNIAELFETESFKRCWDSPIAWGIIVDGRVKEWTNDYGKTWKSFHKEI